MADFGGSGFMDTQIFNLGLSMFGTSAYIVITSLVADGVKPSLSAVRDRWNAAAGELEGALAELMFFNVVEKYAGPEGELVFMPNPASLWKLPGPGQDLP